MAATRELNPRPWGRGRAPLGAVVLSLCNRPRLLGALTVLFGLGIPLDLFVGRFNLVTFVFGVAETLAGLLLLIFRHRLVPALEERLASDPFDPAQAVNRRGGR